MHLRNKRIFLVEDNLAYRALAQLLLERAGAKTAIERWGTESIARIRAFMPVDVILLDLHLPDNVSGFDLFDDIRAEPDLKHIPIVAVSSMEPSFAIPKAKAKGFEGFILKPIESALFVSQVADVLASRKVWFAGVPSFVRRSPERSE